MYIFEAKKPSVTALSSDHVGVGNHGGATRASPIQVLAAPARVQAVARLATPALEGCKLGQREASRRQPFVTGFKEPGEHSSACHAALLWHFAWHLTARTAALHYCARGLDKLHVGIVAV
jgi:hypothetical protein